MEVVYLIFLGLLISICNGQKSTASKDFIKYLDSSIEDDETSGAKTYQFQNSGRQPFIPPNAGRFPSGGNGLDGPNIASFGERQFPGAFPDGNSGGLPNQFGNSGNPFGGNPFSNPSFQFGRPNSGGTNNNGMFGSTGSLNGDSDLDDYSSDTDFPGNGPGGSTNGFPNQSQINNSPMGMPIGFGNFPGQRIPNSFPGSQYPETQFGSNQFSGNQFPGNQYPGSQLSGSQFTNFQFPPSQFSGSHFPGTQSSGSQLSGSQFPEFQFSGNQIPNSQFSGSQIPAGMPINLQNDFQNFLSQVPSNGFGQGNNPTFNPRFNAPNMGGRNQNPFGSFTGNQAGMFGQINPIERGFVQRSHPSPKSKLRIKQIEASDANKKKSTEELSQAK